MRYFLITYDAKLDSNRGIGNIVFSVEGFPSSNDIKDRILTDPNLKGYSFVILNIFEFKSKSDFDSYVG